MHWFLLNENRYSYNWRQKVRKRNRRTWSIGWYCAWHEKISHVNVAFYDLNLHLVLVRSIISSSDTFFPWCFHESNSESDFLVASFSYIYNNMWFIKIGTVLLNFNLCDILNSSFHIVYTGRTFILFKWQLCQIMIYFIDNK